MATEEILMAAVQAGGDRQALHEVIRTHSLAAAEQVKQHGKPNDLLDRLRADAMFERVDAGDVMKPERFVGRAPQQVEEFVEAVVEPVRRRYAGKLGATPELRV